MQPTNNSKLKIINIRSVFKHIFIEQKYPLISVCLLWRSAKKLQKNWKQDLQEIFVHLHWYQLYLQEPRARGIQLLMDGWMDSQNAALESQNAAMESFSNKKINPVTCYNTDEPSKHYVSWKSKSQNTTKQRTQPQSNKPLQILYDFTYTVVKLRKRK